MCSVSQIVDKSGARQWVVASGPAGSRRRIKINKLLDTNGLATRNTHKRGPRDKGSPTASQGARLHDCPRRALNPTHASDQRQWIVPTFSRMCGEVKNMGEVTVSEFDFFEVCCHGMQSPMLLQLSNPPARGQRATMGWSQSNVPDYSGSNWRLEGCTGIIQVVRMSKRMRGRSTQSGKFEIPI